MDFRPPHHVMAWLGPVILTKVFIWIAILTPEMRSAIVSGVCAESDNCMTDWVGALSGWAALAGALLTIGVMRDQLQEQRRQTSFELGDGLPTIAATRFGYDEIGKLTVQLINWNRRAIEPESVVAEIDGQEVLITLMEFKGKNFKQQWSEGFLDGNRINKKIVIPGWTDRSREPPITELEVSVVDRSRASASSTKMLRICLRISICGERIETADLATTGPIMIS